MRCVVIYNDKQCHQWSYINVNEMLRIIGVIDTRRESVLDVNPCSTPSKWFFIYVYFFKDFLAISNFELDSVKKTILVLVH